MSKLDDICKQINKEWKEDVALRGLKRVEFDAIPFSSSRLNYCLYGGLPRNRLIEFAGEEGSGKTTTALDVCKQAQIIFQREYENALEHSTDAATTKYLTSRGPKRVVYIDCENTLDEDWARLLDVDVDNLYIIKPQTQSAEDIFDMIIEMVKTDEVGLAVLDSLGVMISKQAFEKDVVEKTYGGISAPLTLFSKKMVMLCRKHDCTFLGINQVREDMSGFGRKITTGGKGWKHNCSLRIFFEKGDYINEVGDRVNKSAESPAGNKVTFKIEKTKVCKPDRKLGQYTLMYDYGIDEIMDLVEVAIKMNFIIKAGGWFSFIEPTSGEVIEESGKPLKLQGMSRVLTYLYENEEMLTLYKTAINDNL